MKLSIVTTLYQSQDYVKEFYYRCCQAAQVEVGDDIEFLFVNDGSPDNSLIEILKLQEKDTRIRVVDLSKNFGHHKAMMTGLRYATGDLVFLLDSDLEEEPEWLNKFYKVLFEKNCDVVYGVQAKRRGNFWQRAFGKLFYRAFRSLTNVEQPDNIVTARLMTRKYVDALISHEEREVNIGGLFLITGFYQVTLPVVKLSSSPTSYTMSRKLSHILNAITSFSSKPLYLIFYSGLILLVIDLTLITLVFLNYLLNDKTPDGYTSIFISVWIFGGVIILFLGTIGLYLAKIFIEVKNRPYTVVKNVYENKKGDNANERHSSSK